MNGPVFIAHNAKPRLHRRTPLSLGLGVLAWAACGAVFAAASGVQAGDEDELSQAYGDKPFVSIASGSRLPVSRAPAVATVITAEDIAAMGATDLDEVLETVPGLHVARATQAYAPVYVIRGLNLGVNPQVLMLLNGLPLTSLFAGNRGSAWGGLPVDHIARIEVIRGPGSALYGADAFAGVVNIITKTTQDLDGTEAGLRLGSFKSADAWLLHGGKWGEVDVAGYLRKGVTDGARSTVQADAQTGFDRLFGTQASRAPGPIDNGRDAVDGLLDLSRGAWRWRTAYKDRRNMGSSTGVASALDPTGRSSSQTLSSDLAYDNPRIAPDWALSVQGSYLHYEERSDLVLYPAGAFGGAFADGMIGNPYKWEQHQRLGGALVYTGLRAHRLRLGAGYEYESLYKVRETKNFVLDQAGLRPIGQGSFADVVDVTNTTPFLTPHGRHKRHVYLQDEWQLATDWTLTAGLRQDRYGDLGSTTNPRVALVWEAAYNVTAKLLYGTAFRPPSVTELYAINNPVAIGNPTLAPERIRTVEAALTWQPTPALQLGGNVFRYEMRDIIQLVGTRYQNTGEQEADGIELEANWEARQGLRLSGNYSYQHAVDEASGRDPGNSPHHHAYLRADWQLAPGWSLHPQANWISERPRAPGDPRPSLHGYQTIDLTLRRDTGAWALALSVRNLFNNEASEPSPDDHSATQPFVSLPNDFPLPGRALYVQLSHRF
jgi:outer membrane receptor for ferrienterochelin and colicins